MVDVSIVIPCLNEEISLRHCIENAQKALQAIAERYGLAGEIIIADNGSVDSSQSIARNAGVRLVYVKKRGYGAAIIGGMNAAEGRYFIMADADGSYDFLDSVPMIGQLCEGVDLCMGSRFRGGILPGAMPWKNRYIGNPLLTGILNLFYGSGVDDAHCGLRAISKSAFEQLQLRSEGMEFASEMIVKASLKGLRIVEVPATLSPDMRERPPHLRPWRDGWRHLRYLLMLSPTWVFGVPAIFAMMIATLVLGIALLHYVGILPGASMFGATWTIVAGFLFTSAHFAVLMALAMHLHGVHGGQCNLSPLVRNIAPLLKLEALLTAGVILIAGSFGGLGLITFDWTKHSFVALPSVLPVVIAATAGAVGLQTIFGSFVLAIVGGHSASFGLTNHLIPLDEDYHVTTARAA